MDVILPIFFRRFLGVMVLLLLTWNAWGLSFWHWVAASPFEGINTPGGALKILAGVVLAIAYVLMIGATAGSLGLYGLLMMLALCGAALWYAQVSGWVDLQNPTVAMMAGQIVIALVLALGSVWAIVWRRVTGQVMVDDDSNPT